MNRTKPTLDKDLGKIVKVEAATRTTAKSVASHTSAVLFLGLSAVIAAVFGGVGHDAALVIVAAVLGGYMALNIGANDVANNVGPAVGSRAMSLTMALIIAAIFESAGALIAGGDVVSTISKGIIDPSLVQDSNTFVRAMMASLVAAAIWVNLATIIGAPVSTTHSVVGGVMGAGIAAVGFKLVNWATLSQIAASWVISPLLGGVIAALFLAFIKVNLIYQEDKIAAARKWIPLLIAVMAGAFATYLSVKGLKPIWKADLLSVTIIGLGFFVAAWAITRPLIRRQSEGMENRNRSLRELFRLPLICSAALLSFAHGANDVANAIGPLAAIIHSVQFGDIAGKASVPGWVMVIGAFGISIGLFIYGPKLIRMVGNQITKMNPMRAYCVMLSAAITVIIASWLGLPVSSTHIAVGAVFGVGFFREYYTKRSKRRRQMLARASGYDYDPEVAISATKRQHRKLVRRSHFLTIVVAWVVTVPAAAILAAMVFYLLDAIM